MIIQSVDEVAKMLRANKLRSYPSLSKGSERLFPFARPQFKVSKQISSNAKFFLAGNCFARGMEKSLKIAGFDVISSAYSDELSISATSQFQNFNKYSLCISANEIAWATGQSDDMYESLIEVGNEFVDMQLHFSIAYPKDEMYKFRKIYNKTYEPVTVADVIILTVGGRHQWYDVKAGIYLNAMPTRKMETLYPNRFELHSLDLEAAEQRLERAIRIVRKVNSDAQILFVNSPVFHPTSYSHEDALLEQTLSKSLQRLAIANVCERNEGVDYLPAYEVVTLSDYSHSFEPSSPNHTLPDVACRVTADMIKAGGVTGPEQRLLEAEGYGRAYFRAQKHEEAEKLLAAALLEPSGELAEAGKIAFRLHRLYIQVLDRLGKRRELLSHGLKVLRAFDADASLVIGASAIERQLASQGRSPLEALVQQIVPVLNVLGSKEEQGFISEFIERRELKVLRLGAQEASKDQPDDSPISKLQRANAKREDDGIEAMVAELDIYREALTDNEKIVVDTASLQSALRKRRGGVAIKRQLDLFAKEEPNLRILRLLCNSARSAASLEQLDTIIALAADTVIDLEVLKKLQDRKEFLERKKAG